MSAMMDSMEQHKFNPLSKHAVPENNYSILKMKLIEPELYSVRDLN